jgi:carbamoyltransferase
MQARLNLKIKYRESFRPFAPSVLAEKINEYFAMDKPSPYMLLCAEVQKAHQLPFDLNQTLEEFDMNMLPVVRLARSDIPAVTHVDYSARIQTVDKATNPRYYAIISAFEELTGCGVIVNTSFNLRGEPIVCTPQDAYKCFMRSEMDALMLGDFLLRKEQQPEWKEQQDWRNEYELD